MCCVLLTASQELQRWVNDTVWIFSAFVRWNHRWPYTACGATTHSGGRTFWVW